MQKRITTTLTLILLTLTLTQLAAAEWKNNEFANNTSGDLYVAFTTLRPAKTPIPQGWRTVGWYLIRPGGSHTFQAWADNPIYYLIWESDTEHYLTPANAKKFTFWEHIDAFVTVSEDEPNVPIAAADLLYSNRNRGTLIGTSEFFKSGNGGSVTVNATGVVAPLAEFIAEEDDDTVSRPDTGEQDMSMEPGDGGDNTGVSVNITPDPIGTTLNQGQTRTLTVSVTENGDPLSNRNIFLSVPDEKATVNPTSGKTDDEGQFSTTLTVKTSSSEGAFNVTANLIGTTHSTTLSFEVQVGVGQISISSSPATIEPGQTSRITFTTRTPGGDLFPNVQLSLSASVGNINPTLVTTGSNGQGTATFRANPYSGTPRPGWVSSPKITAIVVDSPEVRAEATLTVTYIVGSMTHNAVSSIVSGSYDPITFNVKSRSGTNLSGVRVSVSESDSEIQFNSSSGTTNSSGNWLTHLYTKSKGSASFTVSVSGLSSRTHSLTVQPQIREVTRYVKHDSGCRNGGWLARWHRFEFPGKVVSYTVRSNASWSQGSSDLRLTDDYISADDSWDVIVTYNLFQDACNHGESWGEIWVDAEYEVTADSFAGAPSLPSQRYEEDPSLVTAHPQMQLPVANALLPNYPNPFNPETWIPYHLAEPAEVTLSIYSAEGRLVRTLALGHQAAGIYESKSRAAYWDGRNSVGERVASGLYFYTLTAGDFAATGKMLIMQ